MQRKIEPIGCSTQCHTRTEVYLVHFNEKHPFYQFVSVIIHQVVLYYKTGPRGTFWGPKIYDKNPYVEKNVRFIFPIVKVLLLFY